MLKFLDEGDKEFAVSVFPSPPRSAIQAWQIRKSQEQKRSDS